MKLTFIALFLFLLASTTVFAQAKITLYYTKGWELTKQDSARYIRTAIYDSVNYNFNGQVEDLYLNGKTAMKGTYVRGLKEGEFTFYYENGNIESVGKFESGSRSGLWKYFYRDGKPKSELEFVPVLGNEATILFLNDSTGKQILKNGTGKWHEVVSELSGARTTITGEYKNNEKTGKWDSKTMPGRIQIVEHFKNGQFLNGFLRGNGEYVELFEPQNYTHPLPAKFQVTETFRARSGIDFKTYPQLKVMLHGDDPIVNYIWDLGEPAYLKPERSADPPGGYEGLTNALSKIMQYPEEAQVMGIAGKVYVELIVDKDGSLKRFKIVKGIGGGCDEEVLRVMSEYAAQYHWNPAIIHGQPVKQLILLSLLFQM